MTTQLPATDYLSQENLFQAFKAQLAKDFEQSNFPGDFIKDLPADYHHIHQQLVQALSRGEKSTDTSLQALLYRIDISEAQLKKYLSEHGRDHYLSTIAELIIKRVLQKVVTREMYKRG
jgi:hypothetical protein